MVECGRGPPYSGRRPNLAASNSEGSFLEKRPDLSDGGLYLPLVESGLLRFVPPKDSSACTAVTSGDARDDSISDPKKLTMRLHVNWGHASATQLRRVLVDSDGGMSHLVSQVEDVFGNCDV